MPFKILTYTVLTSLFFVTASAQANGWILTSGIYNGIGSIRDTFTGKVCSYDMKLTVGDAPNNELYVIRRLDYHDPIHCDYQSETHFVVKNIGDNVYRVSINNYDADHGFCSSPNFCMHHLSYTNGSKVTEGIYEKDGNYVFSGMGTYAMGVEKTWSANLVKQTK